VYIRPNNLIGGGAQSDDWFVLRSSSAEFGIDDGQAFPW